MLNNKLSSTKKYVAPAVIEEAHLKAEGLIKGVFSLTGIMQHKENVLSLITERLEFILSIPNLSNRYPFPKNDNYNKSLNYLNEILDNNAEMWVVLLSYAFLSPLGFLASEKDAYFQSESWYREFRFGKILMELANQFGFPRF